MVLNLGKKETTLGHSPKVKRGKQIKHLKTWLGGESKIIKTSSRKACFIAEEHSELKEIAAFLYIWGRKNKKQNEKERD